MARSTSGRDLLEALDALPGVDFSLNPAEWHDAAHSGELDALAQASSSGASRQHLDRRRDPASPIGHLDRRRARRAASTTSTHHQPADRHAERMRYRVAIVDSRKAQSIGEVRQFRAKFDSKHMAFYYPWVKILDPITRKAIVLPPSGFVAGIYARNDIERAVWKGAGQRSGARRHRLRADAQHRAAGSAQPRGHQLLPLLRGTRHALCGARAR
jgi:hypothetical protein